jgi:hypothetical protein
MPNRPWDRERAPAAPALTDDGLCSECNAPAKLICKGEVKVCSKCLAVLWHSGVVEKRHERTVAAPVKGRLPATPPGDVHQRGPSDA